MSRFRPATPADAAAWQALLGRSAAGDFLHDWAWADVAAFDGQPQRRFVLEEDGELVALVAAQERRLPLGRAFWYVPHGPVLDYADARAAEWLRAVAIGLREVGGAGAGVHGSVGCRRWWRRGCGRRRRAFHVAIEELHVWPR